MVEVLLFPLRFTRSSRSRWIVLGVIVIGILSGFANMALVGVINSMLFKHGTPTTSWIALFAGLCALVPAGRLR